MEIGNRIKEIRTAIGITQVKFAERIAVAKSLISELENGIKEPNERVVRLIVAEFNTSENWLRSGIGSMFNEDVSAEVSEAIGIFKSLDQRFREAALKMLVVLKETNEAGAHK